MEEWSDLEKGTFGMIEKLTKLKEGLLQNEVKGEFFTKETKIGELCAMLRKQVFSRKQVFYFSHI